MERQKKYRWQDTNLSLHGSDLEKKIKAASAEGEPQWENVGESVGLRVWRIEAFRVVPWPRSRYGHFHEGDSYVVLNTYKQEEKFCFDIHFWIGKYSTADEYGTAAYKSVELDHKLNDAAVIHREVQSNETDAFCSLFGSVSIMKGGIASGFNHVAGEKYSPKLLHFKGEKGNAMIMKEVKLKRSKLNSGDVFVLDLGLKIYTWNGKTSNPHEKMKANEFARSLQSFRGGRPKLVVLDEGQNDESEEDFWAVLPGERRFLGIKVGDIKISAAKAGGDDSDVSARQVALFRLNRAGSSYKRIASGGAKGTFSRRRLDENDVFLLDDGFAIYVWVGRHASTEERSGAIAAASNYLRAYGRPSVLPIIRISSMREVPKFSSHFYEPEISPGCCIAF